MASLKRNVLWNTSYRVFQIVIPLVITPYLSRTLGASGVGMFSYTNAIVSYFALVAMLGVSTHGMRSVASVDSPSRKTFGRVFCNMYAAQLVVGLPVLLLYLFYSVHLSETPLLSALWIPTMVSALLDISWFVFGTSEFKMPTIRNYVLQIVSTMLVFLFVKNPDDVWIYILVSSITSFASQLCLVPYVAKRVSYVRPDGRMVKSNLKANSLLFLPVAAISVYTMVDKVMLGFMAGMDETGFFTYADKIVSVSMAVLTAFGSVMLPKMTGLVSKGEMDEARKLLGLSMLGMQIIGWGVLFGIIGIAPELVPVFLGDAFVPAFLPLLVLSLRVPLAAATNVLGNQYLLPSGEDALYTKSVCFGALVNIVVNACAIPSFGCIGAAFASVLAELTVLLCQAKWLSRALPLKVYAKQAIPYIVLGVMMLLVVRLVAFGIGLIAIPGIVSLLVEIMTSVSVYVLGLFVYARISKGAALMSLLRTVSGRLADIVYGTRMSSRTKKRIR